MQEQQPNPKRWKKQINGNSILAEVKNPLRNFIEKVLPSLDLSQYPNRPKDVINLSIGDPTISPQFRSTQDNLDTFANNVGKVDGYTDVQGYEPSREAVVKHFSVKAYQITRDDVYMTNGASMALWTVLRLLANAGDNFLFPTPGFPLSLVMAKSMQLEPRFYHLQADNKWNADIKEMESLIDDRTRFILVNDPSNPLGSCWSAEHKRELLELAKRKKIPLLVDQIYETMTYYDKVPTFAQLVKPEQTEEITLFKCSGLTKKFLGPGWRLGWLIVYASKKLQAYFRTYLRGIFNVILMPNTIMQCSLPDILDNENNEKRIGECMQMMKQNQQAVRDALLTEKYCSFGYSAGAFYATIILKTEYFTDDVKQTLDFAKMIFAEQNVKIFPGDFFVGAVPFIRLVLSCNNGIVQEFIVRFKRFCQRHLKA